MTEVSRLGPTPLKPLPQPPQSRPVKLLSRGWQFIWTRLHRAGSALVVRWRSSLQFRAVAATVLLTAVAFLCVGAFLSSQIAEALYTERATTFREESNIALNQIDNTFFALADQDRDSTQDTVIRTLKDLERSGSDISRKYLLTPINPDQDTWVNGSASAGLVSSQIPANLAHTVATGKDQYFEPLQITNPATGKNVPAIAYGMRVSLPPGEPYALYLVYDLGSMQETLDSIHRVLWLGGSILLVLIGAIAWVVTRSVVRPVSQAAVVSERLAAGHLEERLSVRGEDEVARLGAAFNHMASSLQDQITQLAKLSQMQQRFVSDVSHELRTPLTTVRMAADVLHQAREDFDPVSQRSAEILNDQVERFQALLDDLLEVSRFDAGVAILDLEPTNLMTVVKDVLIAAEPLAASHHSQVRIRSLPGDYVAEVDPRRIERIVRNLVVNGLEHGEGEPLDIYLAGDEDAIAIAVRDHGVGMSRAEAARVFDRFWRADPARARTTGGSGLGLSIAEEDARLHDGWLQAWGEPGKGACFRLTLPRRRSVVLTSSPLMLPPENGPEPKTCLELTMLGPAPQVAALSDDAEAAGEKS